MSTIQSINPNTTNFSPSVWLRSRKIALWEVCGIFFINISGAYLHFAFELSGFWRPMALIASVNESTWEHLKFYFWSTLLYAIVEYTYVRSEANNYLFAKVAGVLTTIAVICLTFYGYLAIALPIYGEGFLWADISTGVIGVIAGQLVSSYLLQSDQKPVRYRQVSMGILAALVIMFSTFTYFPPNFFIFEDYYGYVYTGQFGILEDYTPYLIFQ